MKDLTARVIGNREVAGRTYLMTLECDMEAYRPGQFVMLKAGGARDPLLRRPLGIMEYGSGTLALLYKVKGEGTRLLSGLHQDDRVSVLGPLGQGFQDPAPRASVVYVAGGTGAPPLIALAKHLKRGRFLFGARTREDVPFECLPHDSLICTEDGSCGQAGLVTQALASALGESRPTVYACGPLPMLKAVWDLARASGAACQVSLEERMACGFGVCSGCAVETVRGIERVCSEGPVFRAEEIQW
ncbi:MAG TPA: dihydroorotate dehydrogenase electron transfer subunit [Deltaproteobacteria bacterium]|nr:dihydroorotate dehydrogenase electron transfer subunit [Deltaproteobacteria bacterium]